MSQTKCWEPNFELFNFFIRRTPEALRACQILRKGVCFQVRKIKVGNLGVLHKTKLEGYHTLTFGLLQLFNIKQPRGSTGLSNFPLKGCVFKFVI